MNSIPTGPNIARLEWRSNQDDGITSVVECEHSPNEERFHVFVNGVEISGHWKYEASWYLIVGAQHGSKVTA
jgi:hypothetical protein